MSTDLCRSYSRLRWHRRLGNLSEACHQGRTAIDEIILIFEVLFGDFGARKTECSDSGLYLDFGRHPGYNRRVWVGRRQACYSP
jgi:hypothetical protein